MSGSIRPGPLDRPPAPPAGLCGSCRHARRIETRTGSVFLLCGLSAVDPAYPRYPRLPVLRCAGYRPPEHAETPGGVP